MSSGQWQSGGQIFEADVNQSGKNRLYYDLLEACTVVGCPLCRLTRRWAEDYLDNTLYERVTDVGERVAIRDARGYCNLHAWMLTERQGAILGTAIIQQDVLQTVLAILQDYRGQRGGYKQARRLAHQLHPTAKCPVCVHCREMETIAIHALFTNMDDPPLQAALSKAGVICLPHFIQALEQVENDDQARWLLNFQRQALQTLCDELSELIRKHDYRFSHEGLGTERDSWLRAIGIVSGARNTKSEERF